jgi:adenine deaminase
MEQSPLTLFISKNKLLWCHTAMPSRASFSHKQRASNAKAYVPGLEFDTARMQERLKVARGDQPAAFVVRGAQWLDVFSGQWAAGDVAVFDGVIVGVGEVYEASQVIDGQGCFLVPGFIDAHVHIESSMMTPERFAAAVLPRGTTSVIWDPHEIANVKGVAGIEWALSASEDLPLQVFIMIPSCVPSTSVAMGLETSGAVLTPQDLAPFADHPRVLGLAEMMNWPGLVGGDREVVAKLAAFQDKKRDGHCPGLSGKALNAYGVAGIHSCHESTTAGEAQEKLRKGIHVLIREGSCAKDADALLPLLDAYSSATMGYCSDDRNPLDIEEAGHLDCIVNKALKAGHSPIDVFRAASFAVARMYGLDDRGAIAPGYRADFVLLKPQMAVGLAGGVTVDRVCVGGRFDWDRGVTKSPLGFQAGSKNLNVLSPSHGASIEPQDFAIAAAGSQSVRVNVIGVRPGQIVTDHLTAQCAVAGGHVTWPNDGALNKISVIERHHATGRMANAIVSGLGITSGAIATSINHDCHNIIVTGATDALMAKAVGLLQSIDGGIVVVSDDGRESFLRLPIGGLMTDAQPSSVAQSLRTLKKHAKAVGCLLEEPFLQLSFLALPVIPKLKITDRGLVDGVNFKLIPVVIGQQTK